MICQGGLRYVPGEAGTTYSCWNQPNMAKLTVNLSPSAEMTPGIASFITELLYRNGVSIFDTLLGSGDIIIVVDDRDGPLAYDVLQREIYGPDNKGAS